MKEKDLDKCLDNLIIKGLIQEAEQDNADFEIAMREMSNEDFLALIYDTVEEPVAAAMSMEKEVFLKDKVIPSAPRRITLRKANHVSNEWDEWDAPAPSNKHKVQMSGSKVWKIWAGAIASVAAILLFVFVPAYREMDTRLCESALLASEAYMPPSRGTDISSMNDDEVKDMLPELEKQYAVSIAQSREPSAPKGIVGEQNRDMDDLSYYMELVSPRDAGMELVQAYLKLNQKDKAIGTLRELAESDEDHDFSEYCQKMLEILE